MPIRSANIEHCVAGVQGSRTLRAHRRMHASGFEVREAHRDPSTPTRSFYHDTKARKFRIRVLEPHNKPKGRFNEPSFRKADALGYGRSSSHLKDALQLIFQDALWHGTYNLLHRATVSEDQQRWDASHSVRA